MNTIKSIDGYKKCIFCGNQFPYRKTLKARGCFSKPLNMWVGAINQKFCSHPCSVIFRNKSEKNKINTSKRMIGNQYGKRKLRIEERIARRNRNLGSNSHFWQGGVTAINKKLRCSLEYKLWREAVFKRDKYICQHCGTKGGKLHADHIKQFAYFPDDRFNVNNGRTLCVECHKKTPTYLKRRPVIHKKVGHPPQQVLQ